VGGGPPPPPPPHAAATAARIVHGASPTKPALVHLAVVGDTYTVLVAGEQTAGRFAMLDMLIPPGGGPPLHRHDFEECFRVLEGSLEVRVRDLPPARLEAGDTANIPANAPTPFATQRRFRRGCCVRRPLRAWSGSSPSSATLYRRARRRPRRSVTPSAESGCAVPWRRPRGTAWRSCLRPRHEDACLRPAAARRGRAGRRRAHVIAHLLQHVA
jgi:quercetin dioxygenase-like cupin family protein